MSACAAAPESAGSARQANGESLDLQQFLVLTSPPEIAAYTPDEIVQAQRRMASLSPQRLRDSEGSTIESANALPFLTGSAVGREFLATRDPRVLVRGAPSEFCPTALVESGNASTPDLAATALRKCLAQSSPKCGCEVVAAGAVLMVPKAELAYATAIAARIRAPSLGVNGFLVAEEARDGGILLRDLKGAVGRVRRTDDDHVTVTIGKAAAPFEGRAIKVGFRRGRIAERIYARDADGNRLSLLIGFDPTELAQLAGAWLAWPSGG